MLVKLLLFRRVPSRCPKRLSLQDTPPKISIVSSLVGANPDHGKRNLSTTAIKFDSKPVIYSASDLVKSESLGSGLSPPAPTVDSVTGALVDPSFVDLGLATSWWPSHIVEGWFESFHLYSDLSWVATIAIGTAVLRLLLLPAFIASKKTMMKMTTHGTELGELRQNMVDKTSSKNIHARMVASKKYRDFTKKHKLGTFRMLSTTCIQPFAFISCYRALIEMSSVPVPSMAATSFLWISCLSDPDPLWLLPAISGALIGVNLYSAVKLNQTVSSSFISKYIGVMSFAPVLVLPLFLMNYPSAFGVYLVTNSLFTVAVTLALANNKVKEALKMPDPVTSADGKRPGVMSKMFKETFSASRRKTEQKMETKEIQKTLKEEKKLRKKELKQSPSTYYEIGTEAKLKEEFIPDFKKDYRPPRPDMFKV